MNFLLKILVSSLAVMITSYLLPGVNIDNYLTAIIVAFVLAILNMFIKPVLVILTIPITLFTFGLFLLFINAFMIEIAGNFVKGFVVHGFGWALLFSIILSIVTSLLESLNKHVN